MDTLTIILNVIVGLALILAFIGFMLPDKDKSYDFMHDYFGLPKKYDLPSEITVEIVKEKPQYPEKPSASQTVPSSPPSSAQVLSSEPVTGPKRTAGVGLLKD